MGPAGFNLAFSFFLNNLIKHYIYLSYCVRNICKFLQQSNKPVTSTQTENKQCMASNIEK